QLCGRRREDVQAGGGGVGNEREPFVGEVGVHRGLVGGGNDTGKQQKLGNTARPGVATGNTARGGEAGADARPGDVEIAEGVGGGDGGGGGLAQNRADLVYVIKHAFRQIGSAKGHGGAGVRLDVIAFQRHRVVVMPVEVVGRGAGVVADIGADTGARA